MTTGVRTLIVAEVRLYRDGLTQVLADDPRVVVIGAAASVDAGADLLRAAPAEVILLSIDAAGARTALTRLALMAPAAKIIALGVPTVGQEIVVWAEAGAHGVLTTESSIGELVLLIQGVVRDETPYPPHVAALLFRRLGDLAAEKSVRGPGTRLTNREREVSELLAEGLANKEIARQLQIELPTVKNHVHNILEKLQVRSRGEAVANLRHR
jgi:DNA-binding NarL/FixJ family response regulator